MIVYAWQKQRNIFTFFGTQQEKNARASLEEIKASDEENAECNKLIKAEPIRIDGPEELAEVWREFLEKKFSFMQ